MRKIGHYEDQSFIPDDLPPKKPIFNLDVKMATLYGQTMFEIGRLNEMTNKLPDLNRFIKAYVIKEALLSSSIEGIHTTFLDVYTQPFLESKPNKNTQLVMNYSKALEVAISMIKKEEMPISSRVILKTHETLMQDDGQRSDPGNFRKQSVKVGNLIPPAASRVAELMGQLENYINVDESLPVLIKAGLAHVQFEIIHPFLDGNGRIGRLLIILILLKNKLLLTPAIYPSYYFKKHHLQYYQKLDEVRTNGDFEGWITFYLNTIKDSCIDAYARAKDILKLNEDISNQIIKEGKSREIKLKAVSVLFNYPIISIGELSSQLKISYNTANKIILDFIKLGFVIEENKQKRGRLFKFKSYFDVLQKEY